MRASDQMDSCNIRAALQILQTNTHAPQNLQLKHMYKNAVRSCNANRNGILAPPAKLVKRRAGLQRLAKC